MVDKAPIEIWHKILKYVIAVPLFFEPDPINIYGLEMISQYSFEAEYWESERRRNILRRVCQSWNAFLKPYDHRYAGLLDVYGGLVRMDAIPMAIRLNVKSDRFAPDKRMKRALQSFLESDNMDRLLVQEWRTEILDGDFSIHNSPVLVKWLGKLPHLRGVSRLAYSEPWNYIPQEAALRFLLVGPHLERLEGAIAFQHLTTLRLVSVVTTGFLENWQLPSLQHLSIDMFPKTYRESPESANAFAEKILEIVRHLGKNLITLHYRGLIKTCPIPDIWPHIPHVERIQLPYWEGTTIPVDHPVRIVTIPLERLIYFIPNVGYEGDKGFAPLRSILKYLPHSTQFPAPNLIIRMDVPWFVALTLKPPVLSVYNTGDVIWLQQYCEGTGAEFTDSDGITFQRYLVFLIQYFWRDHRAQFSPEHNRYKRNLWIFHF